MSHHWLIKLTHREIVTVILLLPLIKAFHYAQTLSSHAISPFASKNLNALTSDDVLLRLATGCITNSCNIRRTNSFIVKGYKPADEQRPIDG